MDRGMDESWVGYLNKNDIGSGDSQKQGEEQLHEKEQELERCIEQEQGTWKARECLQWHQRHTPRLL